MTELIGEKEEMSIKTCNKDTLYNALDKIKELEKQLKIANEGLTIAYMSGFEDGKKKSQEELNK